MQTLTIEVVTKDGEVKVLDPVENKEALWRIFSLMMAGGFSMQAGREDWVQMTATVVVSAPHEEVNWLPPA